MAECATKTKLQAKENASAETLSTGSWQVPELSKIFSLAGSTSKASLAPTKSKSTVQLPRPDTKLAEQAAIIEETLTRFGAPAKVREVHSGPTITQFALALAPKVSVSKVEKLADNLALALADKSVRLEFPVLGQPLVGVQIANSKRTTVGLGQVLTAPKFKEEEGALKIALGEDVTGQPVSFDLTRMPHLLIAGSTGSGKSVCLNALIASLLAQYSPDELQFVMIDPKRVELTNFNGIPHLIYPVITQLTPTPRGGTEQTEAASSVTHLYNNIGTHKNNAKSKTKKAADVANSSAASNTPAGLTNATTDMPGVTTGDAAVSAGLGVMEALAWTVAEMERRYALLANYGYRHIQSFNQAVLELSGSSSSNQPASSRKLPPDTRKLPYLVVVIDELAELMLTAPQVTESFIVRLAQKARAVGIHLVLATQRPSVDVVTGLIKANVPGRIAFAVRSQVDSRVILDSVGAEKLLGKGDMLFLAQDAPNPVRLQGVFVSDNELDKLVEFWRGQAPGLFELHNQMSQAHESNPLAAPGNLSVQNATPGEAFGNRAKAGRGSLRSSGTGIAPLVLFTPPLPVPLVPPPATVPAKSVVEGAKESEKEKELTRQVAELQAQLAAKDKELAELRRLLGEVKPSQIQNNEPLQASSSHFKLDKMEVGTVVFANSSNTNTLPVTGETTTATDLSNKPKKPASGSSAQNSNKPTTHKEKTVPAQIAAKPQPRQPAGPNLQPAAVNISALGKGENSTVAVQSDLRTTLFSPEQKRLDALLQTVKKLRKDQRAVLKLLLENRERSFTLTEMAAKTGYGETTLQRNFPVTTNLVMRLAVESPGKRVKAKHEAGFKYRANLAGYVTRNFPGLDPQVVLVKLLELLG